MDSIRRILLYKMGRHGWGLTSKSSARMATTMSKMMRSPKKMPRIMPASCRLLTKSTPVDFPAACTGVPWATTEVGLWGGLLGGGLVGGEGEMEGGLGDGGDGLDESAPCRAGLTRQWAVYCHLLRLPVDKLSLT